MCVICNVSSNDQEPLNSYCSYDAHALTVAFDAGMMTEAFTAGPVPDYELQPPALDRYRDLEVGQFQFEMPPAEQIAVADVGDLADQGELVTDIDEFTRGPIPEYDLEPPALDRYRELSIDDGNIGGMTQEPPSDKGQSSCVDEFLQGPIPEYELTPPALDRYRDYDPSVRSLGEDDFMHGPIPEYEITPPALDRYREFDLDALKFDVEPGIKEEQTECSAELVEQRDSNQEAGAVQKEFSAHLLEQRDSLQHVPTKFVDIQCMDDEDISKPDELDFVSALDYNAPEFNKSLLEQRDSAQRVFAREYSKMSLEQRDSFQVVPEGKEFSGMALEQRDSVQGVPEGKVSGGMALEQRDSVQQGPESREYSGILLESRDSAAEAACCDDADSSHPDILALDDSMKPTHAVRCNCTFCRFYARM
jgi:hypothetical protein